MQTACGLPCGNVDKHDRVPSLDKISLRQDSPSLPSHLQTRVVILVVTGSYTTVTSLTLFVSAFRTSQDSTESAETSSALRGRMRFRTTAVQSVQSSLVQRTALKRKVGNNRVYLVQKNIKIYANDCSEMKVVNK